MTQPSTAPNRLNFAANTQILAAIEHAAPNQATSAPRVWDMDMTPADRAAIDQILDHLIQTGAAPSVSATGDIVDIVTAITNALNQSIPPHLAGAATMMMDYLSQWLCDYVDETGATTMRIAFGFNAQLDEVAA